MNQKWIALVLAAVLAACLAVPAMAAESVYSDVPAEASYASAVEYCRTHGLMNGTGDGKFSPQSPLTRAQTVTVLYRLSGSPEVSFESGLTDVPDWCADAVAWAERRGILTGYADGTFHPAEPVTRQQVTAFLWRMAGRPTSESATFKDNWAIASYAREAISWARATGVISGYADGAFHPLAPMSRANMARILMNYDQRNHVEMSYLNELSVLCAPSGIAAAEDGSILVTDTYNKAVWMIKDGVSTRYAGAESEADVYGEPVGGAHDSSLSASLFRQPWAIAPFLGGWAVTDTTNASIRLLLPGGVQTLNPSGAEFQYPTGLAADAEGNLYVADTYAGTIYKITAGGKMSEAATGLNDPTGLCWKNGTLYVAETGANRIVKISGGTTATVAGSGEADLVDGAAAQAAFSAPQGVAVDDDGTVYVADTVNSAVRRIQGGAVDTLVVENKEEMETIALYPRGLLLKDEDLYVCDNFARKVFRISLGS